MGKAILYFLAAGAAGVGGPAVAVVLRRLGQQEAAAHTQARDAESVARLLRCQIGLAPLREQALAVGVDPDLVEQAYRDTLGRLGDGCEASS
jgi:hypothetical protein